jgi:hypothetical protein
MHDEKSTNPEPAKWGPCPKGEWNRLSEALQSNGRNSAIILNIIAIALAALAITGVTWMLTASSEPCPCDDAQSAAPCPVPVDKIGTQNVKP